MKKIVLLWILLPLLTGCIVETAETTFKTIKVTVDAHEWQYTQQGNADQFNNNYFYATIQVAEITSYVFNKGEVSAYLVKDRQDTYYARKHPLPYVLHKEELVNNSWLYFTETIDFTYGIGWAEINYRASDFAYEDNVNINPPKMEFDIVIVYP